MPSNHARLFALALAAALAGPATAETFSAEVDVIIQGCCIPTASATGATPQSVSIGPVSSPDGLRSGQAGASASRGGLHNTGASASNGGKITGLGLSSATFDDLLFTWNGPGPAPDFISFAALNYTLAATQLATGALGTVGGFNGRQLTFSLSFNGDSVGGSVVWDVSGDSGQGLLGGHQLSSALVPIGAPVTVHMELTAGAQATLKQVGSPVHTAIDALLQITGPGLPAAAAPGSFLEAQSDTAGPVFDLPAGFTVNSVSMGVVDNQWIFAPVPEPASLALVVAGGLLLAWRLRAQPRAACSAGPHGGEASGLPISTRQTSTRLVDAALSLRALGITPTGITKPSPAAACRGGPATACPVLQ